MLVIFDFDGTLADSWTVAVDALRSAARSFGYPELTSAEVDELRGRPTRDVLASFGVPLWRVPRMAAHVRDRLAGVAGDIELFDGVPEMLAALEGAGVKIGVVSSNAASTVEQVLGPDNLRRLARVECGATLLGKSRRFQRLMREVGADKARTIAVGDESRDLDAAAAVGIVGLGVEWGYARPSLLQSMAPGRTFSTVPALTSYLLGLARG